MATKTEMFKFLDALRESGDTNMFGAGRYLQGYFSIDKQEAREVLTEWMQTFAQRHPIETKEDGNGKA